mgnify:CR=1 FL=1
MSDVRAYIAEWREMEDQFYRQVLNDADLYMLAIRLVRAVTDRLQSIDTLEDLVAHFERSSSVDVAEVGDALESPQVILLDYQLALGAGFYLRAQEIQNNHAQAAMRARLAEARALGQQWVTLYNQESRQRGHLFFQRLDMRLSDGLGVRSASEMDWERGRVFVLDTLQLDPYTGELQQKAGAQTSRREFRSRAELELALQEVLEGGS